MFNRIPFGGAGGIMADRDFQFVLLTEIVPEMIQPCCIGRTVAATIVGKKENAPSTGITLRAILFPPSAERVHGEGGCVMAEAEIDSAFVTDRVVDAVRDALG